MAFKTLLSETVSRDVFIENPELNEILHGFTGSFQITWAGKRNIQNTSLYCFILKPSKDIADTFGISSEISLFRSQFSTVEPRTFQAIDRICSSLPFNGRIDQSLSFLNSPDPRLVERIQEYQSADKQGRIIVPFKDDILRSAVDNIWKIKNCLKDNLFIRDLFDYRQPIVSDYYFYGRERTIAALVDNIKKTQNSGVFGLRKTGKTSLLLRVERIIRKEGLAHAILIDCQRRPIRRAGCDGLISMIIKKIDSIHGTNHYKQIEQGNDSIEVLSDAIKKLPRSEKVCLIFDEIEYVSPLSPTDAIWGSEFIDFWQAIRSIQTETDKICFIVCGVNPTVCDVDRFPSVQIEGRTVQNPLFGIVNVTYLKGLDGQALRQMIYAFGRRMGLRFSEDAIQYLFDEYGGHPLLTRIACSYHHQTLLHSNIDRPVSVEYWQLKELEEARQEEISVYAEHVISEVREFYDFEYQIMLSLAKGDTVTVFELSRENQSIQHLLNYGLLESTNGGLPKFSIPVVAQHIKRTEARKIGERYWRHTEPEDKRALWLETRKKAIVDEFEQLNEYLHAEGRQAFFPGGSPRKISEFMSLTVTVTQSDAASFCSITHKVFVENIERHFKSNKISFHKTVRDEFPTLYLALMRIKLYRHHLNHIDLEGDWITKFYKQLERDFDGKSIEDVPSGYFLVQQICLDELHVALQTESAKR